MVFFLLYMTSSGVAMGPGIGLPFFLRMGNDGSAPAPVTVRLNNPMISSMGKMMNR